MYKASIELVRINKMMRIKFGLIMEGDVRNQFQQLISRFNYSGNDYFRINPKPFVTIDISSKLDKGEEWTSNRMVTLNRMSLFFLIKSIERLAENFVKVKNLYYMDNGKLILNRESASNVTETIRCNNKTVRIQPCVVPSDNNDDSDVYEGCAFFINRVENFAYLTYQELTYLLYELKKIDMSSLSLHLISIVTQENLITREKESEHIDHPVSEKVEIETGSSTKILNVKQETGLGENI